MLPFHWIAEKWIKKLMLHKILTVDESMAHFPTIKIHSLALLSRLFLPTAFFAYIWIIHLIFVATTSIESVRNVSICCAVTTNWFLRTQTQFYCSHGTNVRAHTFWYFPFDLRKKSTHRAKPLQENGKKWGIEWNLNPHIGTENCISNI